LKFTEQRTTWTRKPIDNYFMQIANHSAHDSRPQSVGSTLVSNLPVSVNMM